MVPANGPSTIEETGRVKGGLRPLCRRLLHRIPCGSSLGSAAPTVPLLRLLLC